MPESAGGSMKLPHAPRREAGANEHTIGTPGKMAQSIPLAHERDQEHIPLENMDTEVVIGETASLRTVKSRAITTEGKGEGSRIQGRLAGLQNGIPNTEDQGRKGEFEEHKAEETEDKTTKSDDGQTPEHTGNSQKRSKKLKVERNGEKSYERSRSQPRRTSHKGKT